MTEPSDVIVLGLGAMGSSACMHLARRGMRVLGLDQFPIAHNRGSSHGLSRMIRMCYYEHPDYVPLLHRAYELWRELESASGERLLHTPGGVYMGREDAEVIAGSRRAAAEHGLAHEMLDRAALARRFPQFEVPDDFVALFEPVAGWLAPERAIRAAAGLARRHGAELRCDERVVEWEADGRGVSVRTVVGGAGAGVVREHRAKHLVIAAGAWATGTARTEHVSVRPTRQVLGWFHPADPGAWAGPRGPVWAMQTPQEWDGRGDLFYGFPVSQDPAIAGGAPTLKVARHAPGPPIDPDRDDRHPRPHDEGDLRPFLGRFLPLGNGPLAELRVCMYENSLDAHFIIDHHPRHGNVLVAAGFSGHGFKFASVVGEVLADLVVHGRTRHPIGFLGLSRLVKLSDPRQAE